MSIQVTPIPRLTVLAAPAFTLGTANAAGSATSAVASDSTLLAFDTTLPDAITLGQSGAVGSAVVVSRRDHAHQMASVDAASQAQMEAASSTSVFDTPGRTKYHPGVAKVWCNWEMTGAHGIRVSYNYTSVTDAGLGITDHVIDTDFSSGNYVLTFGGVDAPCMFLAGGTQVAGLYKTFVENGEDGTRLDSTAAQLVGFGTQ